MTDVLTKETGAVLIPEPLTPEAAIPFPTFPRVVTLINAGFIPSCGE
jgi:hypothetical protein